MLCDYKNELNGCALSKVIFRKAVVLMLKNISVIITVLSLFENLTWENGKITSNINKMYQL